MHCLLATQSSSVLPECLHIHTTLIVYGVNRELLMHTGKERPACRVQVVWTMMLPQELETCLELQVRHQVAAVRLQIAAPCAGAGPPGGGVPPRPA